MYDNKDSDSIYNDDDDKENIRKEILKKLENIKNKGYSEESMKELTELMKKHSIPQPGFDESMEGAAIAMAMLKWSIQKNGLEKTLEDIHNVVPNLDALNFPPIDSNIYDGFIHSVKLIMDRGPEKDESK